MMNRFLCALCFCAALLHWACKEDLPTHRISGTIIDAYSKEPIPNVSVNLLEDGPTVSTDANGKFQFENASVEENHTVQIAGRNNGAVAISHPDYYPAEGNVAFDQPSELTLSPRSIPAYFYHQPVHLNDGLTTSTLSEAGFDSQLIHNMMDKVIRADFNQIHSILVYKDGNLALEEYFYGNNDTIKFEENVTVDRTPDHIQWSRKDPHYVASVNKALTSTILGIALAQNEISVDEKISDYLPQYATYFENDNTGSLDFEDCLTMTAGFQWDEWSSNDLSLLWKSDDFGAFVLSRTNLGPGSEWRYNSALPNLMLKAVDNMVGGNVRDWAHDNFYAKLGIENYKWQSQPDGYPEGSARMYLTPRDMLKIGITYLNDGQWAGEQIIPQAWVQACMNVKEETSSGDYSYHFWLRELNGTTYLSADGDGGNYINIFPDEDMVIVITQGLYLQWPNYVVQANEMMGDFILPAIE
ncbi:MAG: serine hydrolase [Marinoscillum sp.]